MTEPIEPHIGELAIVQGPLVRVTELSSRGQIPGAVVRTEGYEAWVPLVWLIRVPLDHQPNGGK